jgi:hypothetical protein
MTAKARHCVTICCCLVRKKHRLLITKYYLQHSGEVQGYVGRAGVVGLHLVLSECVPKCQTLAPKRAL